MSIFLFYRNLIATNRLWLERISIWAAVWFFLGVLTFIIKPELLPVLDQFLDEVFRQILGGEQFAFNFHTAWLIFKNNFQTATLILFLGIVFGLLPLAAAAVNFFVLGFLSAVLVLSSPLGSQTPGILVLVLTILPHGVMEIPAFLIASAFGLKLGLALKDWKHNLKRNLELLPLLALLFFLAALVEVFATGKLVGTLLQ